MIVSSDGSPTVPANATLPVSQLSFQLAVSVDVSSVNVASVVAGCTASTVMSAATTAASAIADTMLCRQTLTYRSCVCTGLNLP